LLAVGVLEGESAGGKAVQIGGDGGAVAIGADGAVEIVCDDEEDVGGRGAGVDGGGGGGEQGQGAEKWVGGLHEV
jgi:hypothetical protein